MKKIILLTFSYICLAGQVHAQQHDCGFITSKTQKQLFLKEFNNLKKTLTINYDPVEIPVVFHIIYTGTTNNIDSIKIARELADLNRDFQLLNSDVSNVPGEFQTFIGNPQIKFVLATKDPDGKSTTGIIRVKANRREYNFNNPIFYADKIWNPKKYLNVYVGEIRNGLGRRTNYVNSYPWRNLPTDAIALSYNWVGESTRVLTHEAGHWLGLWHINEGGCSKENDGIEDTKKQKSLTGGCPNKKTECSNNCMFMNYMDYSDCRVMFTKGQADLIRIIIIKYRQDLFK